MRKQTNEIDEKLAIILRMNEINFSTQLKKKTKKNGLFTNDEQTK